jgi:hypothetical protein
LSCAEAVETPNKVSAKAQASVVFLIVNPP